MRFEEKPPERDIKWLREEEEQRSGRSDSVFRRDQAGDRLCGDIGPEVQLFLSSIPRRTPPSPSTLTVLIQIVADLVRTEEEERRQRRRRGKGERRRRRGGAAGGEDEGKEREEEEEDRFVFDGGRREVTARRQIWEGNGVVMTDRDGKERKRRGEPR